jgi:hypothetical protein
MRINALLLAAACCGCGAADPAPRREAPVDARAAAEQGLVPIPIGRGPEFHPPAAPPASCARGPLEGRFRAHVELFGDRQVIVIPAGIGVARPFAREHHRIVGAGCRAAVRTLESTGVVDFDRSGLTLGDLFAVWGQPLGPRRMASFRGRVVAFVGGRRVSGDPAAIPLRDGAQIVLEVGGYVPPHPTFKFPPRG